MNGRLSTPLPNVPYPLALKNKHFDQVNMQKDIERPQVSKATGKWKDFGKREWDPVGGNWKITPSNKKSPDIPERSDKISETTQSVLPQPRRADNEPAHKRSFGQINTDLDAAMSQSPKRRILDDKLAKDARASRHSASIGIQDDHVHERGRSRQPVTQTTRTIKREQNVQPDPVRQQSIARELSKDETRAFLYGSNAPNVGIEAATAALRQAREKKEISQKTGLAPTRRDSAHADHNAKIPASFKPRSPDKAASAELAPIRDGTTGFNNALGSSKVPFIEEEDSDDPLVSKKTVAKTNSVNNSLFVSTKDPVRSGVQKGSYSSPSIRRSPGDDRTGRSASLTQRSPIKVFRPTVKYSSPLGTKLDEPRSPPDLQKASQALSEATSEQQVSKAQSHTENLQKKQLGGYLHLKSKDQQTPVGESSQQSRISDNSAINKAEDEVSWKMAKAATAMQRVMQKPVVNNAAIAAQAKAGAQSAAVPKLTATGFTFERPDQSMPARAPSLTAAELDAITNTGPESLRSVVDSRENIRELIADASKKTETKQCGRDRSRSRAVSINPISKLGKILGEDADENLISEDDFILTNADQGWVARKIADQLRRRHGIKITPGKVRKRYDELRGTRKGIPLRENERDERSTSQAPSASNPGDTEREDESFELDGNDTEDEADYIARTGRGQSSLRSSRPPVGQSKLVMDQDEMSSASGQETKATMKPAPRPTTGGKSLSSWKAAYYDALTTQDSDEEGEGEDLAPATKPADRIFNVYTVFHRVTTTDDPNPEVTEPDRLEQTYYDLGQANTVAQKAAFGQDFHKNGSLSWDFGDDGHVTWSYIHGDMITTTWVEREERLLVPSDPQPDDSVNIIGRTVWAIKEEISQQDPFGEWQVVSTADVGSIYSSLSLANKAAATHLLEKHILTNPPKTNKLAILDQWKAEQRGKAKELTEWFEERKQEFEEICELGEGRIVKVAVVARDFLGARN